MLLNTNLPCEYIIHLVLDGEPPLFSNEVKRNVPPKVTKRHMCTMKNVGNKFYFISSLEHIATRLNVLNGRKRKRFYEAMHILRLLYRGVWLR